MEPPYSGPLPGRTEQQLDALLTVLHRVADALENLTLQIVAIENPTFTPISSPENGAALFPDGSPRPCPKTRTQCRSCRAEWTKTHTAQCSLNPGRTVEHSACEEVPVHE